MMKHTLINSDERLDKVNDNISLIQKTNGLTFGTDALLLAAFIRKNETLTALDFGAGTGIVSFLCAARRKFAKIYAVEAQEAFCDLIDRNIELNSLSDRVFRINSDIRALSFASLGFEADAVVTNPPYMRSGSGKTNIHDIKTIARHEVLGGIDDFCISAAKNLKHGGLFYAVYRPERMTELFYAMNASKIEPKRLVTVYPDADSKPSLILVEGKKGASPGLSQECPLVLYTDGSHSQYTDALTYIYENGCFKEQK